MSIPQFFVTRWEQEQAAFGKVLRALPGEQLAYRPHERSTAAGDLAWQLALEQRGMADFLEKGEMTWNTAPRPATLDEIVAAWDAATNDVRERLKGLDDAKCAADCKFIMGESAVWSDTLGNMLWGFLFDMIHHRGQLSTYIRPMGGKVPAIYGPSADDNGS
jgi:uncharacterized damage-inducible protein DinB